MPTPRHKLKTASWLVVFGATLIGPASASGEDCATKVVARVSSPYDGTYDAVIRESVCSSDAIASTVVAEEIAIIPQGRSVTSRDVIFSTEIGSDVGAYVGWFGKKELYIFLPKTSIGKKTIRGPFGIDVHVSYVSTPPS